MHLEQYDRIRARIAGEGLTAELETRIALLVCASKAVNLPFLSLAASLSAPPAWQGSLPASGAPAAAIAWQALNTQLFRESEALTLLFRVTRWAPNLLIYTQCAHLVAPLYAECARVGFTSWPQEGDAIGIEALALGHALLATVRLTPILPETKTGQSPFAVALVRIEQENGRLLQTQIRLLKDGFAKVPVEEREATIARKTALVEGVFTQFLDSIAA